MDNIIFCRVFPTSLKGVILSLFTWLPLHSINSFETLVGRFGMQFSTSQPHHMTSLTLVNIRKGKGESLRLFMKRFNKLNLRPCITWLHPFARNHSPTTCAKNWLSTSTSWGEKQLSSCNWRNLEKSKTKLGRNLALTRWKKKKSRDTTIIYQAKGSKAIEVNRSRVFEEALNTNLLPTPQKVSMPRNTDIRKHYRFHHNFGHSIKERVMLKDKIEKLIQVRHLWRFIQHDSHP